MKNFFWLLVLGALGSAAMATTLTVSHGKKKTQAQIAPVTATPAKGTR